MNVLIVAPHMDDEVLGCGGTIKRHISSGDRVFVSFIAHRIYNHKFDKSKNDIEKSHSLRAQKILGYSEAIFFDLNDERLDIAVQDVIMELEKYVEKIKPDAVYLPFWGDNHQDHRAVFDAARVVLRPCATPFVDSVYVYEVPSSTDQSPPLVNSAFTPNHYVDITEHIDTKIETFGCYETEKRVYPHPRSDEALRVLAKKRGTEIGFEYAEAFIMLRNKWGLR
ncbi:PIG-L deacetylase family protein [Candidatus Omnitrophota bacterium]